MTKRSSSRPSAIIFHLVSSASSIFRVAANFAVSRTKNQETRLRRFTSTPAKRVNCHVAGLVVFSGGVASPDTVASLMTILLGNCGHHHRIARLYGYAASSACLVGAGFCFPCPENNGLGIAIGVDSPTHDKGLSEINRCLFRVGIEARTFYCSCHNESRTSIARDTHADLWVDKIFSPIHPYQLLLKLSYAQSLESNLPYQRKRDATRFADFCFGVDAWLRNHPHTDFVSGVQAIYPSILWLCRRLILHLFPITSCKTQTAGKHDSEGFCTVHTMSHTI